MGYHSFCKCPSVLTLMSRNHTRCPSPSASKNMVWTCLSPLHQKCCLPCSSTIVETIHWKQTCAVPCYLHPGTLGFPSAFSSLVQRLLRYHSNILNDANAIGHIQGIIVLGQSNVGLLLPRNGRIENKGNTQAIFDSSIGNSVLVKHVRGAVSNYR